MQSLQIMEGLIGTACALACLYYARQGSFATQPQSSPQAAPPWHSALGEYARKNPFAAVFGALALGFLLSSWSMVALPRAPLAQSRTVERWHTVTRAVADPAQNAKIATLQATLNTDNTAIAAQKSEIDRLKQLLAKPAFTRSSTRHRNLRAAADMANASPAEANENTIAPAGNANSTPRSTVEGGATSANAGTGTIPVASPSNPGNAIPAGNGTATNAVSPASPNPAPPNPASAVPH
jgi:hypothetical protein